MTKPPRKIELIFELHDLGKKIITMHLLLSSATASAYIIHRLDLDAASIGTSLLILSTAISARTLLANPLFNYLQHKYYGDDLASFIADADIAEEFYEQQVKSLEASSKYVSNKELTVTARSSQPIGQFKDTEIYDWIMFKEIDGGSTKFIFAGTTNEPESVIIEDGVVLLAPGILYKRPVD